MSAISCLIDRPHYGTTYNKGAAPGYYESARMWDLCDLIGAELQSYGAKVGYTRTNKAKDMDLEERGRMAKGYTFLLSPHSNASDDPKTSYVVAMYQVDDHCGEMDEVSKALAKALATNVAKLMGAKAQTWATKSAHDRDGNGYKDDYYGVLRGAHSVHVPAVIIENGFHTNPNQAKWLMKDTNLKKLAKVIAETIAEFYGLKKEASAAPAKTEFKVQIKSKTLRIRSGAGTNHKVVCKVHKGEVYTITKTNDKGTWGRLKSGKGWICIKDTYVKKI